MTNRACLIGRACFLKAGQSPVFIQNLQHMNHIINYKEQIRPNVLKN